jgi:hypothetical protein
VKVVVEGDVMRWEVDNAMYEWSRFDGRKHMLGQPRQPLSVPSTSPRNATSFDHKMSWYRGSESHQKLMVQETAHSHARVNQFAMDATWCTAAANALIQHRQGPF